VEDISNGQETVVNARLGFAMKIPVQEWMRRVLVGYLAIPLLAVVSMAHCFSRPAMGEVLLDGSLGPAGAPPGSRSQVLIPAELGRTIGTNLFHSFREFSIGRNESATFTGPAAIDNVIGRVTGGNPSNIDGALRSEIPSANLWLINPAGVIFGKSSSLSVQGSFHVSTADYLRLSGGGRFDATHPERTILSVAPPQAFGFLSDTPAPIVLDGVGLESDDGTFLGPDGQTLSLVGGDITIRGESNVQSRGGFINLASVASPGEAILEEHGITTSGFERLGRVAILEQSNLGEIGFEGTGLAVRAGHFEMSDASIGARTDSSKGKGMDIKVQDTFVMNASIINTRTVGPGDGGDITISAKTVKLSSGSTLITSTQDKGRGGTVTIDASQVNLSDGSRITTQTNQQGQAGDIRIVAAKLSLDGESLLNAESRKGAVGQAGTIDLRVGTLVLNHESQISVASRGPGQGGELRVKADSIRLKGGSTLTSSSLGDGKGGDISVNARQLGLSQQSAIASDTSGPGRAGEIALAAQRVDLASGARISAATTGDGPAGSISIKAGRFVMAGGSDVSSSTQGAGIGGNIDLTAQRVELDQKSHISAESTGTGRSGNIAIRADNDLNLANGSKITVATKTADAGNIDVRVKDRLILQSGSQISTSVADGKGNGGNITIDPFVTALMGGSSIIARARAGSGGNISITTDNLFVSPDSVIDASSQLGIDGTVLINSPETYISGGLTRLPAVFLNTTSLLTRACHERLGDEAGSLTVRRYELLPDSPYALSAQLPSATGRGDAGQRVSLAQPYLWPAGGCPGRTWQRLRSLDRHAELAGHRT
jgi:filamentous hemagglutinin family protein